MKNDKLNVKFEAHVSEQNNCICDACHDTGTVMKLTLPYTRYHDGKNLSTNHKEYWICARCRMKFRFVMDFPDDTYRSFMEETEKANIFRDTINNALRMITQAKELFLMHHEEDWDIDWYMDRFSLVEDTLEMLRETRQEGDEDA